MPRKISPHTMAFKLEQRMANFMERYAPNNKFERFGLLKSLSNLIRLYEMEFRRLEHLLVANGINPTTGEPITSENRTINMMNL